MAQRVHVLLPVHDRRVITRQCIEQLLVQTYRALHLVVIDDGSTDGTADMVGTLAPEATLIRGDGNLWWAGSLQKGLDWLEKNGVPRDDIVLILNDDTTFDQHFVEQAVCSLAAAPGSMLLAQQHSSDTGKSVEVGVRVNWADFRFESVPGIEDVNCMSTRGLFIRLGDALRCGGFHPVLLPHYLSDYEFTIRALRKGITAVTNPAVKLVVNEDMTGQRLSDKSGLGPYLRSVFTKRSVPNPFYWSSFLLLACPPRFIPRNLSVVWKGFFMELSLALRAHRTRGGGRSQ